MSEPFFRPGWSAAAWCSPENSHKEMDVTLAVEIERIAEDTIGPLIERLLEENARFRKAYDNAMANWKSATKIAVIREEECRKYIRALEQIADYANPNELKYICSPTAEYMKKARAALESK